MAQNRDGSCFPQESDFPARLKRVIGEQSIRSFAAKVGLSASAIHQYLSGKSEPTRGSLIAISEASYTRIEWLVTGRGPMEEMLKTHFSPGVSESPVSILNSKVVVNGTEHHRGSSGRSGSPYFHRKENPDHRFLV